MRKLVVLILIGTISTLGTVSAAETKPEAIRTQLADELIYFVFTDRYLNGSPSNDLAGGLTSDPTDGFLKSHTAFFHGGDFRGLTGTCAPGDKGLYRIKELGFTTVWLTPIVEQAKATTSGAGYHGYWGVKFDTTDPHLGTKAEFLALTNCAKKLGLKVVLDVVTNHTGDINKYDGKTAYIPAGLEGARSPSWLNKISNYHGVGTLDNCWGGANCQRMSDFFTLDDLATENPEVYLGWADVYGDWIKDYGLSGFRVDTAKHVDEKFFERWNPLIDSAAKSVGVNNFTIFGEVWESNPAELMNYVRREKLDSVLDFPFQKAAVSFATGLETGVVLRNLFLADDYYISQTTNANNLVTFLGNHDMGRVGLFISTARYQSDSDSIKRVKLAHDLMYLTRGIPTVYYGDEVGMTGSYSGTDQLARQDMFQTAVDVWKTELRVGGKPIGNSDSFKSTETHPLAKYLKTLSALRKDHPGLGNHQMQVRVANSAVTVVSKRDPEENIEYLVGFNNTAKPRTITIRTSTSDARWKNLLGKSVVKVKGNQVTFTVRALSTLVLQSDRELNLAGATIKKLALTKDPGTGFNSIQLEVETKDLTQGQFWIKYPNSTSWELLGTDATAPFRYFLDPNSLNSYSNFEIKAVLISSDGKTQESNVLKVNN